MENIFQEKIGYFSRVRAPMSTRGACAIVNQNVIALGSKVKKKIVKRSIEPAAAEKAAGLLPPLPSSSVVVFPPFRFINPNMWLSGKKCV
jgi:hypothetical protein